ncbi:MAG: type II toxin-antitoxin system VapC family toxin [Ardenticatenaceae bacterium]|nr:type II toxin-antitoxin system VapC family toxin [Anaerolineales bacterium]MCB8981024.1 type II toxin-antitoxin system VapC family toxin [Ardenticatenaceae bacterium]
MIVVDSNIIAYWLLPGEKMAEAESVWQKDSNWIVPPLWKSEFRNILAQYLRHKKLSLAESQALLKEAEAILEHKAYEVDSDWVLRLVNRSSCSAYDCEYVSLAQRFGVLLVTADKEVLREFPETAVSPQQFVTN